LRRLAEQACSDAYGQTLDQTGGWAGLFYFAARVKAPGSDAQPVLTWPEGNGRLVAHLAKRSRDRIESGWAASEIVPVERDDKPSVDVTVVSAANDAVRGFRAGRVIFAAPQFVAKHLIRDYRNQPHASEFEYG